MISIRAVILITSFLMVFISCTAKVLTVPELNSLLNKSVMKNDLVGVKSSLEKGAEINDKRSDEWGYSAITHATMVRNLDIVNYLIENGANIDTQANHNGTPLMIAINNNDYDMVINLVEQGANINSRNNDKVTIFDSAIRKGNSLIAKYLIIQGIDTSKLQIADWAAIGDLDKVRELHKSGVDLNSSSTLNDVDYYTALESASWGGHINIIEYLVENGADVNFVSGSDMENEYGKTALISAVDNGQVEIVKYLLDNGAEINGTGNENYTAITVAKSLEMVMVLVDSGADVNSINMNKPVLISAVENEQIAIVEYLLASGADVNIKVDNNYSAISYPNNLAIVKILVASGADVNFKNSYNSTPLIFATSRGDLEIVKYLVDSGADINLKNNDGSKAIDIAISNGHKKVVKYLKSIK